VTDTANAQPETSTRTVDTTTQGAFMCRPCAATVAQKPVPANRQIVALVFMP
jgi:hypothetical protein